MKDFLKIRYLYQSGFSIELDNYLVIIDYYKGKLDLNTDKDIIFIVTHAHADHYNPDIFTMPGAEKASYILSSDVEDPFFNTGDEGDYEDNILTMSSSTPETERRKIVFDPGRSIRLSPGKSFSFAGLEGRAFGSTDAGISIYFKLGPICIFHSGDLNAWKWPSFTVDEQKKEVDDYLKIIKEVSSLPVDIAFGPVDPRLEKNAFLGPDYLLNYLKPQIFFPMHFGSKTSISNSYALHAVNIGAAYVQIISRSGEEFVIEI